MASQMGKKGISLRIIHIWLIVGAIVISGLMLFSTFDLSSSYRNLTQASEEHVELRKDARELTDASDYLTEKVQRFAVTGDIRFVDEYFSEALKEHRRESAVAKLSAKANNKIAVEKLKEAMNNSSQLMKREYYAMKLVIEAKGYTEYPQVLYSVEISDEDKALSPEDKTELAIKMVLDDEYYEYKDSIKASMQACLDELEKTAIKTDNSALKSLSDEMVLVRIAIVFQTAGIIFLVWLTSRLGIHPILNAVKQIKANRFISEKGAREFRYLVRAYNNMYKMYKANLEKLNFKAVHDELTGVYNRAGYDSFLSGMDLSQTLMILFDVDNFKSINDTYGHETGDKVLTNLAQKLKDHFRTDDYICRIGGDEFVVFMPNSSKISRKMITEKVDAINKELAAEDDLPATSLSVGVANGTYAKDHEDLFKKADCAMYESKQKGKCTITFYTK